MKHFQLFLLFLMFSFSGFSQMEMHVSAKAVDSKTNKADAGVTVRIYDGATVVDSGVTGAKGDILLKIPTEKKYKIEFSKSGKVTRFVMVNATKIDVELLQGAAFPDVRVDMTMVEESPNIDYSFIKTNAVTEFYFDGKNPTLAYNTASADKMKKEVERVIAAAEKNSGNNEVQFQNKMKEAEALASQNKYKEAQEKFEQALMFKPTDKQANKRLSEMDALVKADKISQLDGQAANSEFDNLIKAAELFKSQKKYQEAIDKYEEALTKKKDQNAEDEIDELMALISKEKKAKENENSYAAAMAAADGLIKQKSYRAARDQFLLALKAKPADPVATKKLAEVDVSINAAQGELDKKKNYDNALLAADDFFKAENWKEAKVKYDEAVALNPSSTYAVERSKSSALKLEEIEKQKIKEEQISKLLAEGTTALNAEQLDPAKTKFEAVLKLDEKNATAIEKLKIINDKLGAQKENAAKEANFKKLVDAGDLAVTATKFTEAIASYEEALKIKADAAVDKKIADAKVEVDKLKNQKENKEKYDLAVKEGEAALAANKLEEAKVSFTAAEKLDDKALLPKDRLKTIQEKMLAAESSKQKAENFAAAMKAGDQFQTEGKLTEARAEFQKAKQIDISQTTPDVKIKAIEELIKSESSAKDKATKYAAALKAGDDLRAAGKLAEARSEYVRASGIDDKQTEPTEKIKLVDGEIAAQNANKAEQEKADKFANAMKAGDDFRSAGKFSEAKVEYNKAKKIDESKTTPDEKIKAIDDELANQASAKETKEKADKFAAAMKTASDLRTTGKLAEAKTAYTAAKNVDPTQTLPDEKIKEIDEQIANESANKAVKEKSEKFTASMKKAGDLKAAGKLSDARAEYGNAKIIDPTQTSPDEKISEIDAEMGNQAASQAKKKQIDDLLAEAGNIFVKKEYENAKTKYNQVLNLDPSNAEATKKITEIDVKINEQKNQAQREADFTALKGKGLEQFSKNQLTEAKQTLTEAKAIKADAEVEAKLKEIDGKLATQGVDEAYAGLIKAASELEAANNYDGAIQKYKDASAKKPTEQLPKDKITELQALKKANEGQAEIDKKFAAAMDKGDKAFAEKDYLNAIKFYDEALSHKPTEQLPVTKAEQARGLEKERTHDEDRNYEKVLEAGQKAIDIRDWEKATGYYSRAVNLAESLKKDKSVPQGKLTEIERLKKEDQNAQAAVDKNFNTKMAEAEEAVKSKSYDKAISLFTEAKKFKPSDSAPDTRIEAVNKAKMNAESSAKDEQLYQEALAKADDLYKEKKYQEALSAYKSVLNLKAQDKRSTDKISEIQQVLDNITNANKATQKQAEFKAAIDKADNAFASGKWSEAKQNYEAALQFVEKDSYALAQIKKAEGKIKENSATEAKYLKTIQDADASFKTGDYLKAKENYNKALQLKSDDYPRSKLIEIENILNPPVVQKGALSNMGTPTDNSILEGQALLAKADAQRKNRTAVALSEENKAQGNLQIQRTEDKTSALHSTSVDIQEIEKERTLNALSDDDSRLLTSAEVINQSNKVIATVDREMNYENAETNDIVNKMSIEKLEADKTYVIKEGVYAENTIVVQGKSKTLQDDLTIKTNKVYESNLATQTTVNNISVKVSENTYEDYEDRKITEEDVRNAQKTYNTIDDARQVAAIDKSQSIKEEVEKNNTLKMMQDAEEMKVAAANKEILKIEEDKLVDQQTKATNDHIQSHYETSTRLDNEKVKLSVANVKRDDNRLADVETIKKGSSELDEIHRNQFNNLYLKTITNQGNIATEKKAEDQVTVERDAVQTKDFAVITATDKKVIAKSSEATLSDEAQRLEARANVAASEIGISKSTAINSEKPNDNKEILKKAEATNLSLDKTAQEKQVQKNYDARKLVEQIAKREIKYDAGAANALGSSYPEGVSQESFNENGIDGMPVAVITRRIVVSNGHGAVYVRKQNMQGITYSKNGEPSTEYIWQKETADGKLTRNY